MTLVAPRPAGDRTPPEPVAPETRRLLLSGNEAVAWGAREAGVQVAAGYPGTPSIEVLECLARIDPGRQVYVEWATNEKVALDVALGAALGGARSLATMKHVGLNVAADTFMTAAYTGARAGLVVLCADDPGMHSSQNEQDNRFFARFAAVPLLEPADSQEARDFARLAFELSEQFDTPVLLRSTTRVSHARGVVALGQPVAGQARGFERDFTKYVMPPSAARARHTVVLRRLEALSAYAEISAVNLVEWRDRSVGVVTSSIAYHYVREALPEASVFKLGLSYPLTLERLRAFAEDVERLLVVEELEPFFEDQLRAAGIRVDGGKAYFPREGELTPDLVRRGFFQAGCLAEAPPAPVASPPVTGRPPVLCPGCPHVAPYMALRQLGAVVTGDIGCYTLAATPPISAMDTCVAMGSSIGMAIGLARSGGAPGPVVATIGDSTFLHAGLPAPADAACNGTKITVVVLDNGTTAMTGGQAHPSAGTNIRGEAAPALDLPALCRALGAHFVRVVDPYDVGATYAALEEAIASPGLSVVITNRPCVEAPAKVRDRPFEVVDERCIACQACMNLGCPSITWTDGWHDGRRKVQVDPTTCTGCAVSAQSARPRRWWRLPTGGRRRERPARGRERTHRRRRRPGRGAGQRGRGRRGAAERFRRQAERSPRHVPAGRHRHLAPAVRPGSPLAADRGGPGRRGSGVRVERGAALAAAPATGRAADRQPPAAGPARCLLRPAGWRLGLSGARARRHRPAGGRPAGVRRGVDRGRSRVCQGGQQRPAGRARAAAAVPGGSLARGARGARAASRASAASAPGRVCTSSTVDGSNSRATIAAPLRSCARSAALEAGDQRRHALRLEQARSAALEAREPGLGAIGRS